MGGGRYLKNATLCGLKKLTLVLLPRKLNFKKATILKDDRNHLD